MSAQTISHYEVYETLGVGGMGVVYRARDLNLGRQVALKFLASHLAESPAARTRFLREARAISALNHPHIATIYEVSESSGEPFLALEYLPGGTLRSKLAAIRAAGRQLPIPDAIVFGLETAEGLAHAHRHGILHRDVKPGNLMFDGEGRLKITDFGLSKFIAGPDVTQGGALVGTQIYMSPEQARCADLDGRSDIYSLGVVLYEMIAGQPPARPKPAPLAALRPDVPPALALIVERALNPDPGRRYARAEDLAADLRKLQRESEALTQSLIPSAPKRGLRRELIATAAVVVLMILAALLGNHFFLRSVLPEQKQVAVLPFANMSKSEANQAFCDGLSGMLTDALSQLQRPQGALTVVPAGEVRRQAVTSAPEAFKAFHANLVITGEVWRTGDEVRVVTHLIDPVGARDLGSRTVTRKTAQTAGLEEALIAQIADLLQLSPGSRMPDAGATTNASAYDLYLRARSYLERWDRPGNLDKALDLMHQAVNADPHYALAFAGLSQADWRKYNITQDTAWLEQAQDAGLRAVELDNRLPAAHINLGQIYADTGRYEDAVGEYHKAIALDPVSADAHRGLASVYEANGKLKDAEATYRKALQLRPNDWMTYSFLGVFYHRHGRDPEAEQALGKVVELTPDNYIGYRNLGAIHLAMTRYADAARDYRQASALNPASPSVLNGLAAVLFYQGQYREAAAVFEKAIAVNSNDNYALFGNLADAYRLTPDLAAKAPAYYQRALESVDRWLARNPKDAFARACRAEYEAKLGDRAAARQDASAAIKMAPAETRVLIRAALVFELVQDRRQAINLIAEALQHGSPLSEIDQEPDLASLRRDPRFPKKPAK